MVCRECEWSEMERDGGSKGCTVAACRDPLVLHNFSRCGKYFLLGVADVVRSRHAATH